MTIGFPQSLAIAGAWGYIGRKFLRAGQALGMELFVYDPGPAPRDLNWEGVIRLDTPSQLYAARADLFHLAVHPEHRQAALGQMLDRSRTEPILVLCEKPMSQPEHPERCLEIVHDVTGTGLALLYDFPELYDPLLGRILAYLADFRSVRIEAIEVQRSKDREDPAIPRNRKLMLPIQYQESVHCLAFILFLLASVGRPRDIPSANVSHGGLPPFPFSASIADVLKDGLTATATSHPYRPPNPEDYRYVVDGRCDFELRLGHVTVTGLTNFLRGAPWAKRRVIRGIGDGRPFTVVADFLEGHKQLTLDGQPQVDVLGTDSYEEVLKTCGRWYRTVPLTALMHGLYPNPTFAHVTYQLSSILWRSSRDGSTLNFDGLPDVLRFDARFADEIPAMLRA